MLLALLVTALVVLALLSDLLVPRLSEQWQRHRARRQRTPASPTTQVANGAAEQRARALLRSCVNQEEWSMYRDLGFIRVWGSQKDGPERADGTGGAAYGTSYIRINRSSPISLRRIGC